MFPSPTRKIVLNNLAEGQSVYSQCYCFELVDECTIPISPKRFVERSPQTKESESYRGHGKSVTSWCYPGKSRVIDLNRIQCAYNTPKWRSGGQEWVPPVSSLYSWLGVTEHSISKGFQPQKIPKCQYYSGREGQCYSGREGQCYPGREVKKVDDP